MEVIFAGKASYQAPQNVTEKTYYAIENLILESERRYSDTFKDIPMRENRFDTALPKIEKRRDNESSFRISAEIDLLGQPDNPTLTSAFKHLQENLTNLIASCDSKSGVYFSLRGGYAGDYKFMSATIRPEHGTYTCPKCSSNVEDSDENYLINCEWNIACCPKQQGEHGLVLFADSELDKSVAKLRNERFQINNDNYIYKTNNRSLRQRKIAWELNLRAKHEEDSSFRSISREPKDRSKIYVIVHKDLPIGYIYWNAYTQGVRAMRQMYVLPEYRRRGFGTMLIQKSVELESSDNIFVVESPNRISREILVRSGVAKREKDGISGIRCRFVYGV